MLLMLMLLLELLLGPLWVSVCMGLRLLWLLWYDMVLLVRLLLLLLLMLKLAVRRQDSDGCTP